MNLNCFVCHYFDIFVSKRLLSEYWLLLWAEAKSFAFKQMLGYFPPTGTAEGTFCNSQADSVLDWLDDWAAAPGCRKGGRGQGRRGLEPRAATQCKNPSLRFVLCDLRCSLWVYRCELNKHGAAPAGPHTAERWQNSGLDDLTPTPGSVSFSHVF